ncbi:Polygalacturonase [Handroanthus impetiginosus]|uniref:Polygalacturonase n=1 Tax=Handroanthus impetiginosus TaxID=429701 RepID=A0A2G9HBS4_9LAMI|nr:Polygalacturonase [Handroanthus impetiginosus]
MKRANINTSSLIFLFVLWLFIFTSFSTIEARKYHTKKSRMHKSKEHNQNDPPNGVNSPLTPEPAYPTQSTFFSILSFGAKANGVSDDSKVKEDCSLYTRTCKQMNAFLREILISSVKQALLAAWKSACKFTGGVVEIPKDYKFLIKPVTLQGPCLPNLVLQIDGTILAPPKIGSWPKSSLYQWINFKWLDNFTIRGSGTADGQGSNWWSSSQLNQKKKAKKVPDMKPTALRFYESYSITVRDIRIINSPLCHLKFDNSKGVKVDNVTISAPESSPNTDGIHLQNSQDVEILHSNIGTGDDCVSIQVGCSNIHVHHINCGPGHGISLGGLGKDRSVACVSNIVVENIVMQSTLYGARIKTWQGGLGSVKNVSFSNIQVSEVKVPITIDQYYCDKNVCKNQTGAVAISGVKFNQIIGTYSVQPIHLACSNSIPCTDVDLISIQLEPSPQCHGFQQALCWNSYGKSLGPLSPQSMDYCVRSGSDFVKRIARSLDVSCW